MVLLSGDSWSFFVCIHGSMNKALKNAGVKEASDNATCEVTTRVGIRAENWLGSTAHKATLTVLDEESTRVLYLSLGGNDVLNHWRKSMSPEEAQAVFERVSNQVFEIATLYKKRRPDIKILVSGYDYPRFTENHPVEEYRKAYLQMESPSPFEANTAIVRFSEVMAAKAAAAGVSYIQHYGLTHYYFGNSEQGLEPYLTLNPDQISTPDAPNRAGGRRLRGL